MPLDDGTCRYVYLRRKTVLKILNTLLIVLFALMIVLVPLREQLRSFLRILFVAFFLDLLAIGIGEYIVGCMPPDNQEEQTDTVGSDDGVKEQLQ